jgi:hypothetical protein
MQSLLFSKHACGVDYIKRIRRMELPAASVRYLLTLSLDLRWFDSQANVILVSSLLPSLVAGVLLWLWRDLKCVPWP